MEEHNGDRGRAVRRRTPIELALLNEELAWALARYGYLTARQIHERFRHGESMQSTNQWLQKLRSMGVIRMEDRRIPRCWPPVYLLTRSALVGIGSPAAYVREVCLGTLEHTLAVADIGISYELVMIARSPSENPLSLVTDRQMRREAYLDAPDRTKHGYKLGAPEPKRQRPDLVYNGSGGTDVRGVAIEVELAQKADDRLRDILRNYNQDARFDALVYYTDSFGIRKALYRAANEVRLGKPLHVGRYSPRFDRKQW